jgi:preprotein translocase subunit SecA
MVDEQVAHILQGVSYIEIMDEPNILLDAIRNLTGVDILRPADISECTDIHDIHTRVCTTLVAHIEDIRDSSGQVESFYEYERRLMLSTIDELWMNHMDSMAHLREEVAFDGYAQKNPLMTYKEKAYEKFITMIHTTAHRVIRGVCTAVPAASAAQAQDIHIVDYSVSATAGFATDSVHTPQGISTAIDTDDGVRTVHTSQNTPQNILPQYAGTGRNDMCPCGSGKKYKQCHGR